MAAVEMSEEEKLYWPTYWSKRLPVEKILEDFVSVTDKQTADVKKSIKNQLDIPYGPKPKQKYDLFGTDLPKDAPLFIFVHGGYWQMEEINRNSSSYVAKALNKKGFKVIVIGYTICPEGTVPGIVEEVKQAVSKGLDYAQENGAKSVLIGGHSVGAHLTISLFPEYYASLKPKQRDLIKAVFLLSGIYDITPLITLTVNDPLKLDLAAAKKLSPLLQNFESVADQGDVKFFVIVGEDDAPTFVEQAQLLHETLVDQGLDSRLELLEGFDHFDIVTKLFYEDHVVTKLIIESVE